VLFEEKHYKINDILFIYFIVSDKMIRTSRALHILFSDVQGHYFKDHHSYFLFCCLCHIPM